MARTRRIYKTQDGKRVPGVTTILGRFKDSGGLLYWANQQGLDGVTLNEARQTPANAGSLAHELAEYHINEWAPPELDADPEVIEKALRAFANFKRWHEQSRMVFEYTEVPLVSEEHRYGGRLDAVGRNPDGKLSIIDFKTGGLYAEHLLQVAAYQRMWNECYPDKRLTGGAHLISFKRDHGDFAHHYFDDLAEEELTFLAMRSLYDRVKAVEGRAR